MTDLHRRDEEGQNSESLTARLDALGLDDAAEKVREYEQHNGTEEADCSRCRRNDDCGLQDQGYLSCDEAETWAAMRQKLTLADAALDAVVGRLEEVAECDVDELMEERALAGFCAYCGIAPPDHSVGCPTRRAERAEAALDEARALIDHCWKNGLIPTRRVQADLLARHEEAT